MIVSSTFTAGTPQADGRRYVVEVHTDGVGGKHLREYLAAVGANHQAIADARAVLVAEEIAQGEFMSVLDTDGAIVAQHQTLTQLAQRLRSYFLSSERLETGRVARWIVNHLESGAITDAQMRNVFNLTAAQWTTLRAKLENMRTQYNAIDAARGE